jgi:signal transduction histidine kinase
VDPHAVRAIVQNLLGNAIRYVQQGGEIAVTLWTTEHAVHLSVVDNGPGIPANERALVFERFYRVPGQPAPGAGLGLAIVRQAAQRLGGSVSLDTGPGDTGCAFSVRLPQAAAPGIGGRSDMYHPGRCR